MMTFVVLGYRKVLVATGQAMFLSCTCTNRLRKPIVLSRVLDSGTS